MPEVMVSRRDARRQGTFHDPSNTSSSPIERACSPGRWAIEYVPAPFPSPTATTPPRQAASELGRALAAAFNAKDADAVARLLPDCWLNVHPVTTEGGGVLYRSVTLFTQALRERFAAGDLTVTVDPTVQEAPQEGGLFFVRSEWKEPDRTTHVDMYLAERDGRWHWFIAAHHEGWPCRKPWVSGTGSC